MRKESASVSYIKYHVYLKWLFSHLISENLILFLGYYYSKKPKWLLRDRQAGEVDKPRREPDWSQGEPLARHQLQLFQMQTVAYE